MGKIYADATFSTGGSILEHNMYLYCYNNSINFCDISGMRPIFAIETPK